MSATRTEFKRIISTLKKVERLLRGKVSRLKTRAEFIRSYLILRCTCQVSRTKPQEEPTKTLHSLHEHNIYLLIKKYKFHCILSYVNKLSLYLRILTKIQTR